MSSKPGTSTAASAARKEGIQVEELPQALSVIDCEKRRGVSRYYAYVIEVTRKNREIYHIYRRYRQFHKMTQRLEERFPVEAGNIRASDRIIPQLPGKKYIGRSAVRDVAELRLPYLDDFLKKLYAMSDKIRYDSIVLGFLKPNPEDINRPYKPGVGYPLVKSLSGDDSTINDRTKPARPTLRPTLSGSSVPSVKVTYSPGVLKKPTKPPPPRPTPPHPSSKPSLAPKGPRAKALYNYTAHYDDEVSLKEGCIVMLLRKLEGNWFEGRVSGKVGLVPGNYLDIIEPLPNDEDEGQSSEETDEWDDDSTGKISCYYKKKRMTIEVDSELIKRPTYNKLLVALRGQLKDSRIVINYKDRSGDLIEVIDDSDLLLMKDNCFQSKVVPSSSDTAPWTLYITSTGDTSVYNTTRPV